MISVALNSFENGTQGQHAFALSSAAYLEDMVNNPVFLEKLKTVTYSRNIYFPNDTIQIEATNDDLIRVITGGIEWMANPTGHKPDNEIDLKVRLEDMPNGIYGGADHPDPTIKTSKKFFAQWFSENNWIALAGHWFHEWLHVAGFQHKFRQPSEQPDYNDAVYTVGNLLVNAYAEGQNKDVAGKAAEYFSAYHIPKEYMTKNIALA